MDGKKIPQRKLGRKTEYHCTTIRVTPEMEKLRAALDNCGRVVTYPDLIQVGLAFWNRRFGQVSEFNPQSEICNPQ